MFCLLAVLILYTFRDKAKRPKVQAKQKVLQKPLVSHDFSPFNFSDGQEEKVAHKIESQTIKAEKVESSEAKKSTENEENNVEVNKSKTNSEDPFNDIADNNEKNEKSKESNGDKMTQDDDDITENDDKMAESEGENDEGITENGKTSRNSVNGCDSNKNGEVNEHSQKESEKTKESGKFLI